PRAGASGRAEARLHLHPALEPEGRDRGPARARAELGRPLRGADPGADGGRVMLRAVLGEKAGAPLRILCLGAHADDIEIGCGGTLLRLLAERPGCSVDWVVLSATGVREREASESAAAFLE